MSKLRQASPLACCLLPASDRRVSAVLLRHRGRAPSCAVSAPLLIQPVNMQTVSPQEKTRSASASSSLITANTARHWQRMKCTWGLHINERNHPWAWACWNKIQTRSTRKWHKFCAVVYYKDSHKSCGWVALFYEALKRQTLRTNIILYLTRQKPTGTCLTSAHMERKQPDKFLVYKAPIHLLTPC